MLLGNVVAADCPPDPREYSGVAREAETRIYYRVDPEEMPVGESIELDVFVCHDGKLWQGELGFDAIMPVHGHGMNYRPEVTRSGTGRFHIKGILFHMPGEWQLDFVIRDQDVAEHLVSRVTVR